MPLEQWNGDVIFRKTVEAARTAMDDTMARCVVEAKIRVPTLTTTLQGSIEMRPTRREGELLVGLWGSFQVNYAIYVEVGTSRMSAQPYMRPAADHEYPLLPGRIRARIKAS